MSISAEITTAVQTTDDPLGLIESLRDLLHSLSPVAHQPIDRVRWVHIDRVQANDYNPNAVPQNEMRLLHTSITADGYTQPVVTIFDPDLDKYVIVDGFHRYTVMRTNRDVFDSTGGMLPIVVLDKSMAERMAATVRHNRARGKHSVAGMGNIVFGMLREGRTDAEVCADLGLEAEELARYKYVTGFAKLADTVDYGRSWETHQQIEAKARYSEEHPDDHIVA